VTQYLSQEWLDRLRSAAASLPERPGVTATVQYVVTGAPDGDVRYHWVVEDGRLVTAALGDHSGSEVTMTMPYDVSLLIDRGELDANAAFMQGRLKIAGDMGKVMALLPMLHDERFHRMQADLASNTTF
jgi:putative sterol carrier protein